MRVFLTLPWLLCSHLLSAQQAGPGPKELSDHFHGTARFTVDKQERLVVDLFERNEAVRRDMVSLDQLDSIVQFSSEERMIMLQCKSGQDGCVDKEMIRSGAISRTGRITIPVPGNDPDGTRSIDILQRFIRSKAAIRPTVPSGTRKRSGA